MSESAWVGTPVRFGVFEADLKSGELRKHGLKIKLQQQPFQILVTLLERPGEVVTRQDLRLKLWPVDTHVDFFNSLKTAINKVREALESGTYKVSARDLARKLIDANRK